MVAHDPRSSGLPHDFLGGIGHTMLSGFNTNFRYRGVLFHVQTEDSGRGNPHVITHLFHGGNIMVSVKQDYSQILTGDDIEGAVKTLMEGQHKKMLKELSRGDHDETIAQRLGPDALDGEADEGSNSSDAPITTEEERPSRRSTPSRERSRTPSVAEQTVLARDPKTLPPTEESTAALSKVFGDRVVSEKPLDEVVLDYLVENARKRRRQPK